MRKLPASLAAVLFGAMAVTSANNAFAQADDAAAIAAGVAAGQPLYARNCQACHGDQGQGGIGERLVNSPIVATVGGTINQILLGATEHGMPPFNRLSNEEIANIAIYIRNSWGNAYGLVTPDQVQQSRSATPAE